MEIIVVGGGIGGLSAANALGRDGHRVTVVERAPGFEPVGAGIVMAPNAVHVLRTLDVDLSAAGTELAGMQMCLADGRILTRMDTGGLTAVHGPTFGITRAAVHEGLAAALPESVEVVLGQAVESVEQHADGVVVRTAIGGLRADLAIAADGLGSGVRQQLVGDVALRSSGTTCWRGLADLDLGRIAVEAWGSGTRVGVVPVGNGRCYYFLVHPSRPEVDLPRDLASLKAAFAEYGGAAGRLIDSLQAMPPLRHELVELDQPVWGTERVILLGDAAHAMTPNQGQGAAMAIEDARALVMALRGGVGGALDRYVNLRAARVRKVQLDSRRIGEIAHWENPVARGLRNMILRVTPSTAAQRTVRALVAPGVRLASATVGDHGSDS